MILSRRFRKADPPDYNNKKKQTKKQQLMIMILNIKNEFSNRSGHGFFPGQMKAGQTGTPHGAAAKRQAIQRRV